jgi:hypothetical protein
LSSRHCAHPGRDRPIGAGASAPASRSTNGTSIAASTSATARHSMPAPTARATLKPRTVSSRGPVAPGASGRTKTSTTWLP